MELSRQKAYGELKTFSSSNTQDVKAPNIRLSKALGGPVGDVGVYCINAARYVTNEEPVEVDHFSECVLNDTEPRTPGELWPADMCIVEAVHEAARAGHNDVVRALLIAKADTSAKNDEGQTALTLAAVRRGRGNDVGRTKKGRSATDVVTTDARRRLVARRGRA
jgi:predicted dehydrogenase